MAVPENLPELLRGEMKYDGLNGNYIESEDTVESKHKMSRSIVKKICKPNFLMMQPICVIKIIKMT